MDIAAQLSRISSQFNCSCNISETCLLLSIRWCRGFLKWQVLFSSGSCGEPCMDLVFDDPSFFPLHCSCLPHAATVKAALLNCASDMMIDLHHPLQQPGTHHYNADPAGAVGGSSNDLSSILEPLIHSYREHQRARMTSIHSEAHARLQFELSTLPDLPGLQMQLLTTSSWNEELPLPDKACFSIPLIELNTDVMLNKFPGDSSMDSISTVKLEPFRLDVTFKLTQFKSSPDLHLQVPLHALHWIPTSFTLPAWGEHMCLMEYLPQATAKVQDQIDGAARGMDLKHKFLLAIEQLLGPSLEINRARPCALFSLAFEGFHLLLHVDVSSLRFPDESPTITLTNVKLLGQGVEGRTTIQDCPWSPRWPPLEQAVRVHNFLKSQGVPNFLRLQPLLKPLSDAAAAAAVTV